LPKKNKTTKNPSLQELILNTSIEKYKLIPIVMKWARELRKKEENKGLTHSQILELALKEVLSGKVSSEMVE
jgi:DNA-directed RNA polymerase subunit K/omega